MWKCPLFRNYWSNIVILIYFNVANNNYQKNSRALHIFVPNKLLGKILDISTKNFIVLKIFDSEFSYIGMWFTDQNSNPLETEDKLSIFLVINKSKTYKKGQAIQFNKEIEYL